MQIIANIREFYYAHRYALSNYRELAEIENEIDSLNVKLSVTSLSANLIKNVSDHAFEKLAVAGARAESFENAIAETLAVIDAINKPNGSTIRIRGMLKEATELADVAGEEALKRLFHNREQIRGELNKHFDQLN